MALRGGALSRNPNTCACCSSLDDGMDDSMASSVPPIPPAVPQVLPADIPTVPAPAQRVPAAVAAPAA